MGGKETQSKATEVVRDVVEFSKTPPTPEPELDTLLKYTKQDGKYYLVPKFGQNSKGQTVVEAYLKMTHKQFNRLIYSKNIEILGRKKRPFEEAVSKYQLEARKLESIGAASRRRSEAHDVDRESLEKRIGIMLENWEVQYRNRWSSTEAKMDLEEIRELQKKLAQMKSQTTDEVFTGTFDKYHFDIAELDRISKDYAKNGGDLKVDFKKETFTGNVHDLISFYEDEIDFIKDNYLDDMNDRLKSNTYYLDKLK